MDEAFRLPHVHSERDEALFWVSPLIAYLGIPGRNGEETRARTWPAEKFLKHEWNKVIDVLRGKADWNELDVAGNIPHHYFNGLTPRDLSQMNKRFMSGMAFHPSKKARTELYPAVYGLRIFAELLEQRYKEVTGRPVHGTRVNPVKMVYKYPTFLWTRKRDRNIHLETLYNGLVRVELLSSSFPFRTFITFFTGNYPTTKIPWEGTVGDIAFLIKQLYEKELIQSKRRIELTGASLKLSARVIYEMMNTYFLIEGKRFSVMVKPSSWEALFGKSSTRTDSKKQKQILEIIGKVNGKNVS